MFKIVLLALGAALILTGCKGGSRPQASVDQVSGPIVASATPGPGQDTTSGGGQGSPPGSVPSQQGLLGVYSISEVDRHVQDRNVVDMIPSHNEIQISFRSDGSFARVAWKQGLVALSETGNFKIGDPDQLTLFPALVNKKTITDGRKTSYKFSLSPDGDELKLWGARGNVAVFHRIKTF
jgi:hypothetical protein